MVAKHWCEDKNNEYIKGSGSAANWAFGNLCFTLFCRGCNTQELCLPCMSISQDGINIDFSLSKTNTGGEKPAEAEIKALHANPFDNHICPFLALGVHLALSHINTDSLEKLRLFQGMLIHN